MGPPIPGDPLATTHQRALMSVGRVGPCLQTHELLVSQRLNQMHHPEKWRPVTKQSRTPGGVQPLVKSVPTKENCQLLPLHFLVTFTAPRPAN